MLIEDDKKLCELTKEYLEMHGLKIIVIEDFNTIPETFMKVQPDLVIMDINLPYCDGFYLCKIMRKKSNVPIIFISARDGITDQIMGVEIGADDYIVKPYRLEILLAKVTALLRRANREFSVEETQTMCVGKLILDCKKFRMYCDSNEIELSKNEFILLKKFIEQKDVVMKRDQLLIELWSDTTFVDDNTLTVNITRLKNKFLELNLKNVIKTRRGIGYWLDSRAAMGEVDEN
jgi:DNA-binding response OmpR family regulator